MWIGARVKAWRELRRIRQEQKRFRAGFGWALNLHYEKGYLLEQIEYIVHPAITPYDKGVLEGVEYLRREKAELVRRSREKHDA